MNPAEALAKAGSRVPRRGMFTVVSPLLRLASCHFDRAATVRDIVLEWTLRDILHQQSNERHSVIRIADRLPRPGEPRRHRPRHVRLQRFPPHGVTAADADEPFIESGCV